MSRARHAYIVTPQVAFVQHPHVPGSWVRTHPCVLLVACPFCRAKSRQLCRNADEEIIAYTHHLRRRAVGVYRGALPSIVLVGAD